MFDIFVNYRTADARFGAASAHEALVRRFGAARVFLDSVSIPVGSTYPDKIYEALDQVQVLTVLIGPEWLSEDPATGARPIDRLDDWVRREIRRAMEHDIVIIPVLLDGVSLPAASELPDDIRDLSRRQYVEVNHRSLGVDLVRLGDCVAEWVSDRPPSPARCTRSRLNETLEHLTRKRRWVTATVLAGTVLLLAWPPSANSGIDSVIGESRTADPCYLIDAAEFIRFGTTRLDPAYGNFNRCDVIIHPEGGASVDVEVQFELGPLDEHANPVQWMGPCGIVSWPRESDACIRAVILPGGHRDQVVIVRAHFPERSGTTPVCEVADLAANVAAERLDGLHRSDKQIPRRSFADGSLAHLDACVLLDGDALTALIPGVNASKPDAGYGHWKCGWSSTNSDADVDLRLDQSEPTGRG
jgi:hypothetical protein